MDLTPINLMRWLRAGVLLLVVGTSTGCSIRGLNGPCSMIQRRMIYRPAAYPTGNWSPQSLNNEESWFCTEDGVRLHGWYMPHKNPKAVVLFAHGRSGNIATRIQLWKQFCDNYPISLFAFDYRGFGRSEGSPTEEGILKDVRAARYYLSKRTGVAEHDIVLMGQSLGGGVVVETAVRDGARGLVLLSTFTSIPDVVEKHLPICFVDAFVVDHFDSAMKIGQYRGPLLSLHGNADQIIPFEQGWKLFNLARGPKQFVTIQNGRHRAIPGEGLAPSMNRFLDSLPPTSSEMPVEWSVGQSPGEMPHSANTMMQTEVIKTMSAREMASWRPKWSLYKDLSHVATRRDSSTTTAIR